MNTIDTHIFFFINNTLSNPITDTIMPFITDLKNIWWLYFILIPAALFDKKRPYFSIILCLSLLIAIGFADWFNSAVLKDIFMRERPCRTLTGVHLLVPCGSGYSFPSSHAANNSAFASFIFLANIRLRSLCILFAFLIAISRIFVGVHYPFDVLSGAIVGCCIGFIFYSAIIMFDKKLNNISFLIRSK